MKLQNWVRRIALEKTGLSAEQYALQILEQEPVPEWLRKSWQSAKEAG